MVEQKLHTFTKPHPDYRSHPHIVRKQTGPQTMLLWILILMDNYTHT